MCQVLYGVNQRLRVEDVDSPLCEVRPVKSVLLVVLTGDRGLCGGYNNFIIKRVSRIATPMRHYRAGWAGPCVRDWGASRRGAEHPRDVLYQSRQDWLAGVVFLLETERC